MTVEIVLILYVQWVTVKHERERERERERKRDVLLVTVRTKVVGVSMGWYICVITTHIL